MLPEVAWVIMTSPAFSVTEKAGLVMRTNQLTSDKDGGIGIAVVPPELLVTNSYGPASNAAPWGLVTPSASILYGVGRL